MRAKHWIAIVSVVLVAGLGVLAWWLVQPHTAEAQFKRAQQAEIKLQADAADLTPEELIGRRKGLIDEYEKVWTEFPDDGWHDDARLRAAEICDELLGDKAAAIERYKNLIEQYPKSDKVEAAIHRTAGLYEERGVAEKDAAAALKLFQAAADLLEKFVEEHPDSPRVEKDLIRLARLWQDHIQDPPIEAKEHLDRYLARFPKGEFADEALWRLGKWYERAEMPEDAVRTYKRLIDEHPKSKYVDQALERQEEIYGKKLNDQAKAKEAAEKIARRNPGTQKGARYARRAGDYKQEELKEKDRKYRKEYYGAPVYDAALDKPFPWDEFQDLLDQKLDTIGYKMDVRIDSESGNLEVSGAMELVNGSEDERAELLLQFNAGMVLEELNFDGGPAEVVSPSSRRREVVRIRLPRPLPPGQGGTLTFKATGKFVPPMSVPEGVQLDKGKTPTGEQMKQILETMKGDMRVRIGQSGYAIASSSWYPLTIYGDIFTTDVTYHIAGQGFEVAATGRMTVPAGGEGTVRRYVSKTPIFGVYFAYGKYVAVERPWSEGRVVVAYVDRDKKELGGRLAERALDILGFYEAKFGRLKQPRLSITITRLPPMLGGIGPAGMMILAEHFMSDDKAPVSLMAHEIAHQWWGNTVPVSFDKGYSMWLSEGFATYCDALYNEKEHGRKFLIQHLEKYGLFYFEGLVNLPQVVRPVASCFMSNPLYRQTVYEKGALVLHALRYLVGDEQFFEVLRQYAAEYEGKHSTIEDFRKVAESVTKQDLRWFFDQWLRRKDFPHYVVSSMAEDPKAPGQYVVTVKQELPGTEGPWRMPIDVAFYGAEGKEHIERKVKMDEQENRVVVRLSWKPLRVVLDPDYWVFRHPGPDNVWPRAKPAPEEPAAPKKPTSAEKPAEENVAPDEGAVQERGVGVRR